MSLVSSVTRIRGSLGGVGGEIRFCQWRDHVRLPFYTLIWGSPEEILSQSNEEPRWPDQKWKVLG